MNNIDKLNKDLIKAIYNNRVEEAKSKIDQGANVNGQKDSAILLAAEKGYDKMVDMLVDMGGNVHAENGKCFSLACKFGHPVVLKVLESHGSMYRYGGPALRDICLASWPNGAIYPKIIDIRLQAIRQRYARLKENIFHVKQHDKRKDHPKYAAAQQTINSTLAQFLDTFENESSTSPADEKSASNSSTETKQKHNVDLPSTNDTKKLAETMHQIVVQMKQDKRYNAVNVCMWAAEMLAAYSSDLWCYYKSKKQGTKHKDLKSALHGYLTEVHPMISRTVHFINSLCDKPV